jgi:hypothetical protein
MLNHPGKTMQYVPASAEFTTYVWPTHGVMMTRWTKSIAIAIV